MECACLPPRERPYPRSMVASEVRRHARAERSGEPEPRRLPETREECLSGPRPCPYTTCRYNLFLDVNLGGGIRFTHPELEPGQMPESCVLDVVAKEGALTLEAIGGLLGLTRERIRQIEVIALERFRRKAARWSRTDE